MRRCSRCGATLNTGTRHRHEDPEWRPSHDDFEGALEGYEQAPINPDEGEPMQEQEREVLVYRGVDGDWYWHEKVGGNIVADGGEGYRNKADAVEQAHKATGLDPVVVADAVDAAEEPPAA